MQFSLSNRSGERLLMLKSYIPLERMHPWDSNETKLFKPFSNVATQFIGQAERR